jgi:microcystin-dependent protein
MASLVSGISVSNGTLVTPAILNANPTLTAGTIITADLADGAITTAKIADGAITSAKLNSAVILVPTGAVMPFAMNSAPTGWLSADGTAVSRTTYSALWTALGTTASPYGQGDGSTTFNLPDLRGYFVRGAGTNVDTTASGAFGVKQADAFQSHLHTSIGSTGASVTAGSSGISQVSGTTSTTAPIVDGANGTPRTASETRPRNIAMLYCIKY